MEHWCSAPSLPPREVHLTTQTPQKNAFKTAPLPCLTAQCTHTPWATDVHTKCRPETGIRQIPTRGFCTTKAPIGFTATKNLLPGVWYGTYPPTHIPHILDRTACLFPVSRCCCPPYEATLPEVGIGPPRGSWQRPNGGIQGGMMDLVRVYRVETCLWATFRSDLDRKDFSLAVKRNGELG